MAIDSVTFVPLFIGLFIAALAVLFFQRKKSFLRRILSTSGLVGFCLIIGFLLTFLNVRTYQRLVVEQPVAKLSISKIHDKEYLIVFENKMTKLEKIYEVSGDEWQLDTKFLKWKAWAAVLGKDPLYRLDRLSGRYRSIDEETNSPRSAYSLADDPGINLWALIQDYGDYLPWVDAYYGSSVFMPMKDGLVYQVNATQSGLIARPLNQAAIDTLKQWK